MNRKSLKVLLLLIIFGVPVFWYLFLQLFGENKFELPVQEISFFKKGCITSNGFYLAQKYNSLDEKNQYNRLKQYADSNGLTIEMLSDTCVTDTLSHKIYLVDELNRVRGSYNYSISDIDRAKAEGDLLIKLVREDGPGN